MEPKVCIIWSMDKAFLIPLVAFAVLFLYMYKSLTAKSRRKPILINPKTDS